jgi:hypothetical protein
MADRKLKFTLDFLAKTAGLKDASALLAEVGSELDDTADAGKKFAAALRVAADRVESDMDQTRRAADLLADALGPDMAAAVGRSKIDEYAAQMRKAGLSVDDVEQNVIELADGIRRLSAPAKSADQLADSLDDAGNSATGAARDVDKAGDRMSRSLKGATDSADRLDGNLNKLGQGLVGGLAFAQVVNLTKELVKATSELEDTTAAAGVTFGDYSQQVEDFAESAAQNYGISTRAALDAANRFAALGSAAGKSGQDLALFSTEMVALAGDLSSFSGAPIEESLAAIGSGLRGEAEPLRRFGILLDDATLRARAMSMGIYDGTSTLTSQQKVLAAHAEILDQSTKAQGDFARTSESTANSLKIASAEMENAKAAAGEALAPAMTAVAQALTPVLEGFGQLPKEAQTVITLFALASAAFVSSSKALQGLGVAAKTANIAMGAIVGTIAIAATAYSIYSQKKEDATRRTREFIDALKLESSEQEDALLALYESDPAYKRLIDNLNAVGLSMQDVEQFTRDGTGPAADFLRLYQGFFDQSLTWDQYAQKVGVGSQALQQLGLELERLRGESLAQADAQRALTSATADGLSMENLRAQGMRDAAEAAQVNIGATDDQTEAIKRQRDAFAAANEAMQAQIDLERELYGDQREAIERQRDYADSQKSLMETMADTSSSVDDQMDAIIGLSEEYGTLNGATLDSREGTFRQVEKLRELTSTLDPNSPLAMALQAYISQLESIPRVVDTQLKLHVLGAVINRDGDFIGMRDGARALGGPVSKDGMYQVGEGGNPELLTDGKGRTFLIPGSDGVVTPISGVGSVGGAGGGPQTVNITITNPVMSGEQLANELRAYIARNGNSWLQ